MLAVELHCTETGMVPDSEKNGSHVTFCNSPVVQVALVVVLLSMVTVHASAAGKQK